VRTLKGLLALMIASALGCASARPTPGEDVTAAPVAEGVGLHMPKSDPSCRRFGNEYVSFGVKHVRQLCGRTTLGGQPIPNAVVLVEATVDGRIVLYRLVSGADGRFCESTLPAGSYQVRACSGEDGGAGIDLSAYTVIISPDAESETLEIELFLGT
jgi:hypothetical protein